MSQMKTRSKYCLGQVVRVLWKDDETPEQLYPHFGIECMCVLDYEIRVAITDGNNLGVYTGINYRGCLLD